MARLDERQQGFADQIYLLLADASEGTCPPTLAQSIANDAVVTACSNPEGK